MSVRRVAVLIGLCLSPGAAMASQAREVGFANLAGQAAEASIESARRELRRHGYRAVDSGALRAALEGSLPERDGVASPALGRARNHLAAAREAYASFEYERALGELARVDELLLDREPSQPLLDLLVQRHLLAGQVHESRERPDAAVDAFRIVRHLDPGRAALDPGEYRPKVVSLYERSAPGRGRGALKVAVAPGRARVWIDGRPLGEAPVEAGALGPGRHWVVASALGRSPRGTMVEVDAGKRRAVTLELEARPATARIAELRRGLSSARSRDELEAGAAELAGAADVDVLVLVRGQSGQVEGAAYDTARGELGAWAPLPSRGFWLVLTPAQAIAGDGGDGGALTSSPDRDQPQVSWYRTGWGKGLLIAGGVLVTGVVLYAALGGDDTYTIGGWCFAGEDCQ